MSEESLNNPLRTERYKKRRKRTSRSMEADGGSHPAAATTTAAVATTSPTDKVALQEVTHRAVSSQPRVPSSGNSNSLELSDDRRSKPRRQRKRTSSRQNPDEHGEGGDHSMDRKSHRRPPKHRMNRSVSEEVLDIQREMEDAYYGNRKPHSRKTAHERTSPVDRGEPDRNSALPKISVPAGEPRRPKQKRNPNKVKQRLSRLQNTSAEEENYQGDLDDEASYCGGFKVDKEDIVVEESTKLPGPKAVANNPSSLLPSQPLDVLFIERKDGGFKKEHKDKLVQNEISSGEPVGTIDHEPTMSDFALATHRAFKVFALFCHGLLGGFALCQCLFVYSLSTKSGSNDNFLQNYYPLSQAISSVYYFLLAICTVSVLDSYGMVKSKSGFFHGFLTRPTRTLSIIVYVLALIFNLSVTMIDDRISLYTKDSTLWDNEKKKNDLIEDWKVINLLRVIGCLLGWILLSITSKEHVEEKLFDDTVTGEVGGAAPKKGNHRGYKDISP